MSLTDTQRAIHAFLADRIEADGFAPSQAEIARAFGFKGVRAAQYHLEALEAAGVIERSPGRARSLRLLRLPEGTRQRELAANDEALQLPVLGQVAAGVPIGADIGSDQMLLLDRALFSPRPDYLLKVKGDSMRDEGIFDGDLIGVHRTSEARTGQVVIARIDDEITVKLLRIAQGKIRLLPRNPDYAPIEVQPGQDFAIEGLYCGLVRPHA
ncbi:transcriptional repressor LexA [Thermomonas sp. S9]|uniref:transcriptional repressor LexA n=1 Tax=Thermomonas sp. S9 TaxID=2885203 RepID=UPI00216AB9A9|nr:transcriptional repressor LexA [Thermomonas sp. S9]MCR6495841.1 transcriptional repressor LexA [Thermomonas sp. S9]